MSNPTYRPNDFYVEIYQNQGKGQAGKPLLLKHPRVMDVVFNQAVSPQTGKARMKIVIGNASSDQSALTNDASKPITENFMANSIVQLQTFIDSLRWCVIKIFLYPSDKSKNDATQGQTLTYRQGLPVTFPDTTNNTGPVCVFVGFVWEVEHLTGLLSNELYLTAIDIGGMMEIRTVTNAIKKGWSFTESLPLYTLIHNANFPDFNEKIADTIVGNKDADGGQSISLSLVDYDITLNMVPFNGLDTTYSAGKTRQLWSALDIVNWCIQFFTSWYDARLKGAGITLAINDTTGNLASSIGTYESRKPIWHILCDVVNRKSGLFLYWTYSGTDTLTATLNIGFLADADIAGWHATPQIEYTLANNYPVGQYRGDVIIDYIDNDSCPYIRVSTLPCNIVSTFSLKDQFYEGWNTQITAPDLNTIALGGIYNKWYSRFIFNPNAFYPIKQYDVVPSPQPQPWVDTNTAFALNWIFNTDPNNPQVGVVDVINVGASIPYDETLKISHTIPISNLDPAASADTKNTPGIVFRRDGNDNCTIMDDCTCRYLADSIQFNPPHSASGSFAGIDRFSTPISRKDFFLTLQIEDTPPLTVIVLKENVKHNDAGILDVTLPYKPTFVMNNTVLAITDAGRTTVVNPNTQGVASLVSTDGTTMKKLYNDSIRYGQFMAKQKIKMNFTIGFIDPTNLLGMLMHKIDVPAVYTNTNDPDAIVGIGLETYNRLVTDTLFTHIVWNLSTNETTYQTDFFNYVPGKVDK